MLSRYLLCVLSTEYFLSPTPPIIGRGNRIDGTFVDSFSACYGNQAGGKDTKHCLSVAQKSQHGEGDWSLTPVLPVVLLFVLFHL